MDEEKLKFVPLSDTTASEMPRVKQHEELIYEGKYSDAVKLLDDNNHQSGFRASLFNAIRTRLLTISAYLLNITAEPEDYYSVEEPDPAFMEENGKKFWIQLY